MRWNARWLRLGLLLGCLAAALVALVEQRGILSASPSSAQAVANGCAGRLAPQTALLSSGALAQLREAAVAASPAQAGRPYEQGAVGSANLWSDNRPLAGTGGGYEVRWWALDAEGRLDDVVVDALRFANPGEARQALAAAADPRCHREGAAAAAVLPDGARLLGWRNPDNAWQQDTLLTRGALLYRVSDAPPGVGAAEVTQQARERQRASAVTQALACLLPQAGCSPPAMVALAAGAGTPAPLSSGPQAAWPGTAAQAAAYAQAVSLRPYDVPTMTEQQPASMVGAMPLPGLLARCAHVSRPRGAIGASSPLFSARRRLWLWSASSSVTVLASANAAASYVSAVRRVVAGACAKRFFADALARSERSHPQLRLARLELTPLALGTPDSYRGNWPYHPVGERLAFQATFATRLHRSVRVSFFEEGFAFAYNRAVVELAVTATRVPIPAANVRYLESVLVGRAEAKWGRSAP